MIIVHILVQYVGTSLRHAIHSNKSEENQMQYERDLLKLNSLLCYTKASQFHMACVTIVYSTFPGICISQNLYSILCQDICINKMEHTQSQQKNV